MVNSCFVSLFFSVCDIKFYCLFFSLFSESVPTYPFRILYIPQANDFSLSVLRSIIVRIFTRLNGEASVFHLYYVDDWIQSVFLYGGFLFICHDLEC